MSHFITLINVEDECYIDSLMEPFCECTEDSGYLEFEDHTQEYMREYAELEDKSEYTDFKDYADKQGYVRNEENDTYGYYYNPNSFWDWFEIGGRWSYMFLVKEDNCDVITYEKAESKPAPDGYRWVCGARKCDIQWDVMKQYYLDSAKKDFSDYESWFNSGTVPQDFYGVINENGIVSWQEQLYIKGESFDNYLKRIGLSMEQRFVPSAYSYLKDNEWYSQGDIGWFGTSSNDKPDDVWREMVAGYIDGIDDNDFIIVIDCHM